MIIQGKPLLIRPVLFRPAASSGLVDIEREIVETVRNALGPDLSPPDLVAPDPAPAEFSAGAGGEAEGEVSAAADPQAAAPADDETAQDPAPDLITPGLITPEPVTPDPITVVTVIAAQGDVLMSHSVRDRNYFCHPRRSDNAELEKFPVILVPGQWLRRRLLTHPDIRLAPSAVVAVGHPRIDILRRMQAEQPPRPRDPEGRLRVLWAPSYILDKQGYKGLDKSGARVPSASTNPAFLDYVPALEEHCELILHPHPRDRVAEEPGQRPDRSALGRDLIDCDVVVTDTSSVIFEAWALGKPVIFPRWLLGNAVIRRSPESAEAHIHAERIGYHPESLEEMIDILRAGPVLSPAVHAFMVDYLETYRRGTSTELIGAVLTRLADPEAQAAHQAREAVITKALATVPAKGATVTTAPTAVRASIQLLQNFLLAGDYAFLSSAIASLRQSQNSVAFLRELSILEIEAALAQGMVTAAEAMIGRLAVKGSAPNPGQAEYFEARLALLRGDPRRALVEITAHIKSGGRGLPAMLILLEALAAMGQHSRFWTIAKRLWAVQPSAGLLLCAVRHAETPEELTVVRSWLARLDKAQKSQPDPVVAQLHALLEPAPPAGDDRITRMALNAARNPAKEPGLFWGWPSETGLPTGLLPLEKLPMAPLRASGRRHAAALDHLLRQIRRSDLPLFLSRRSLTRWLSGNEARNMAEGIELGLVAGADPEPLLKQIAELLLLEPVLRKDDPDFRHFRHPGGTRVTIALYHPAETGGLTLHEDGMLCHFPAVASVVWQTHGGREAPVPENTRAYLEAAFDDARPDSPTVPAALMARNSEILDQPRLVRRLCLDFIAARETGDEEAALALARSLKQQGEHRLELALSGMEKNYLPENLPELMVRARFLLHVGDGVEAGFHIDLWYDYVKAADPDAILVIRSKPLFENLRKARPDLDAIFIKAGIEAEWLVQGCPRLAGVLYLSNTGNTVHFLRFNHVRHVWLGHGDSEKAASCHKFFRAYDEIWCAGLAQVDRFRNSGMAHESLRFRIVGRPTLRPLIEQSRRVPAESFLYLPTWEGFQAEQEYTSIRESLHFIPSLVDLTEKSAWVKFHPWAGQRVTALKEVEQRLANAPGRGNATISVIDRKEPVGPLMPAAGFLVADVSSVVSDFLMTGRPIFLFMPLGRDLRMTASAMPMESYCYVFHSEEQLHGLVRRVILQGDDYLRDNRMRARDYFVDIGRSLDGAFEDALHDIAYRHDMRKHAWDAARQPQPVTEPVDRPMIIGHRGTKATIAENSLAGFRATAAMPGLGAVEFDLHLTSDGEIAIIHDPTLDRTTNAGGPVSARSMEELRALRLKAIGADSGSLLDEGVPDLEEVLDIFEDTDQALFVELKNDALGNAYPGLPELVLARLRQRGLLERCTLTSFSPDVLRHLRYLDPSVRLVASVNYRSVEMMGGVGPCLAAFDSIPGCGITLHHELFLRLKDAGIELDYRRFGMWVLNSEDLVRRAHREGVRQIFTDRPEMAIALQDEICSESERAA